MMCPLSVAIDDVIWSDDTHRLKCFCAQYASLKMASLFVIRL